MKIINKSGMCRIAACGISGKYSDTGYSSNMVKCNRVREVGAI